MFVWCLGGVCGVCVCVGGCVCVWCVCEGSAIKPATAIPVVLFSPKEFSH